MYRILFLIVLVQLVCSSPLPNVAVLPAQSRWTDKSTPDNEILNRLNNSNRHENSVILPNETTMEMPLMSYQNIIATSYTKSLLDVVS